MNGDIEALVLSGELFHGKERSSSPARSESPDSGWHDDELELSPEEQKYRDMGYDSDSAQRRALRNYQLSNAQNSSIGMGPGRTGVKGVIRDRDEAIKMEQGKKSKEVEDMRKRMERHHLGGKTYLEEERERALNGGVNIDDLVLKELEWEEEKSQHRAFGAPRIRFGYLREVGVKQFLKAVEQEERGVWVVVHIYDSSLDRCYSLDERLAQLAKENPTTKFLRARATALEFATVHKSKPKPKIIQRSYRPYRDDDEDEFFGSENDDDYDDDDEEEQTRLDDEDVDLDMLPTLLVYRNGELVHNWVRVDWEAGDAGIDELLHNHNIISRNVFSQEDNHFDVEQNDSDDGEFQASLTRILQRSEKQGGSRNFW